MSVEVLAAARPIERAIPVERGVQRWREVAVVAGALLVTFVVFLYRLSSVVISDMDEGTYLYAGKLLSQGLIPYRDFLLAHPPLVVLLAAGWESIAGSSIMAARLAYLAVVLIATVPLYLVAKRLSRSMLGGLLAVATYTTGMLLLADMGRTIRLEPMMNAFLIGGFALYFLRSDSPRLRVVIGIVFACAILVKLVAAVPLVLLFAGDLFWSRRGRSFATFWSPVLLGGAIVLLPAAAILLAQPHFVEDVILSQVARPGLPSSLRAYYLIQDLERFPAIAIALVAAAWFLLRGNAQTRVISLVALGGTLGLVFAFRTFFGYYLVQILPWLAVLFAVATVAVVRRFAGARADLLLAALLVGIGALVPLAYEEYYFRSAHDHVSSPAAIVPLLQANSGPMYSMYPSFALWAGRPEVSWYYSADSLIPRLNGDVSDQQFIQGFSAARSVVLFAGELDDNPQAAAFLANNFHQEYGDAYYSVWERN
jgi:hypothetical protein